MTKLFLIQIIVLFGGLASAQDIPFDPNVGENGEQTPPPPPEVTEENKAYPTQLAAPAPTPSPYKPVGSAKPPPSSAELSKLGTLAPFSDIAVISRRFLPKTNRFEFAPNIGYILNDAFFNDLVFGARIAYYFREQYGVELIGLAESSNSKSVTDGLNLYRGIRTESFATPTGYYGAAFKWVPVYGKMGLMNKTIVPFDTYFLLGGGVTPTNQATTPPTLHLGAGQLYAIYKWMAFRWDFSFFAYNSTSNVAGGASGTYTNLHLTIGMSFFWPPAEYR